MAIINKFGYAFLLLCLACATALNAAAQTPPVTPQRPRVAVLDFGETEAGRRAADLLASSLSADERLSIIDRGQSSAAALGAGYTGSLNMTLEEARNLGAVIDCGFFLTGDAQTLRRSPSVGPSFYEAYVAIFIVSARTGRLLLWERPSFEAATPEEAEKRLLAELQGGEMRYRYGTVIRRAQEDEMRMRSLAQPTGTPVIEDAPDEAVAEAHGLRLPQPYRRLRPSYPETAARIEAEATVDLQVEIDEKGEVGRIDVVRWAGFGLNEAAVDTVSKLHFRPAMRNGVPIPLRVLLRYNFRKPPKQ